MVLLRQLLGDTLRAQRLSQSRTLREVSDAARVSLGYLSEVERGQKEASSELIGSICEALGVPLSDVLQNVTDTLSAVEQIPDGVLEPVAPAGGASDGAQLPETSLPDLAESGTGESALADAGLAEAGLGDAGPHASLVTGHSKVPSLRLSTARIVAPPRSGETTCSDRVPAAV